jgi:HD-GYP domain-containing protein (c-di-GMP phosphodiesterase class II)
MHLAALLQRFAEAAEVQLIVLTRAGIERIGSDGRLCPHFDPSPDGPCMEALTSVKGEVTECGDRQYITIRPPLKGIIQVTLCRPAGEPALLQATAQLLDLQLQPYDELGLALPRRNPLTANLRTFFDGLVLLRDLEERLGEELMPDVFFDQLVDYVKHLTNARAVVALWTMFDGLIHLGEQGLERDREFDLGAAYRGLVKLPTLHTPVKAMANKHLLRFDTSFNLRPQSGAGIRLHERAYLFCVWDDPNAAEEHRHRLEALQHRLEVFTRRVYDYAGMQWSCFLSVLSIINALEARDTYSRGHSERVMRYAVRLGRAVGLSQSEMFQLRFAAVLHDVGKLGLAEDILGKDTPLDESEWVVVRRHPIVGEALVGVTEELKPVAKIIRYHHERWDGEGYPNRLAGEDIPLLSRILSIAEAFDAMTSERPFRHPLTAERATLELQGNAGQQFEPRLVDLFIENECYREP